MLKVAVGSLPKYTDKKFKTLVAKKIFATFAVSKTEANIVKQCCPFKSKGVIIFSFNL